VIVLIPVSRFRISYEVASGRPFSQFERLVLKAIQQGACVLADLQEAFQIHPRLVIEALVTLTQAGWLAVGGQKGGGFVLTDEGREAARSTRPPATTAVSPRRTFVVMERITGGLLSNDDVRFFARKELERVWEHASRLRADVSYNRLDEGQVQHLLPRKKSEWVRWIGPIDMVSKDNHWIPVNVDLSTRSIVGLPDSLLSRLRPTILDEAEELASSLSSEAKVRTWGVHPTGSRRVLPPSDEAKDSDMARLPAAGWPATLAKEDFRFSQADHECVLTAALQEASLSVFVASAFSSIERLKLLQSQLEAALKRGVNIDVLWGGAADGDRSGREVVEWLRRVAFNAKRDGWSGVLRFNKAASGCRANLLIWDTASTFRACVGSFNWLSAGLDDPTIRDASIVVSVPSVVSALARCAAGLWSGVESEVLSSTGDRWRRIASDLDMRASSTAVANPNAMVRLVLDGEHDFLLLDWVRKAQQRVLVVSGKLGPAAESLVTSSASGVGSSIRPLVVLYGHNDSPSGWLERVRETIESSGGVAKQLPNLHANVVIGDSASCLSSYSFLSAASFGGGTRRRDLGLVVDGAQPSDLLWDRLYQP
jgi:hypothetical protein